MIIRLVEKLNAGDEVQVLPVEPFFQGKMWSYNGSKICLIGDFTIERSGIFQKLHEERKALTKAKDDG